MLEKAGLSRLHSNVLPGAGESKANVALVSFVFALGCEVILVSMIIQL